MTRNQKIALGTGIGVLVIGGITYYYMRRAINNISVNVTKFQITGQNGTQVNYLLEVKILNQGSLEPIILSESSKILIDNKPISQVEYTEKTKIAKNTNTTLQLKGTFDIQNAVNLSTVILDFFSSNPNDLVQALIEKEVKIETKLRVRLFRIFTKTIDITNNIKAIR